MLSSSMNDDLSCFFFKCVYFFKKKVYQTPKHIEKETNKKNGDNFIHHLFRMIIHNQILQATTDLTNNKFYIKTCSGQSIVLNLW